MCSENDGEFTNHLFTHTHKYIQTQVGAHTMSFVQKATPLNWYVLYWFKWRCCLFYILVDSPKQSPRHTSCQQLNKHRCQFNLINWGLVSYTYSQNEYVHARAYSYCGRAVNVCRIFKLLPDAQSRPVKSVWQAFVFTQRINCWYWNCLPFNMPQVCSQIGHILTNK